MYDGTLKFDTSMDTSGFQKDANGLSNIVKGLGVFSLLEKGFNAVTASLDSAIARYDTLNKFPKVLEQMGYSSEAASEATQKLSDGVSGLPTTLDSVVSTSQRLTVLTGNLERSTDLTIALNNAFLASGASSDDASRGLQQYVQMLSSGKVDMESWRTLQETMGLALNKTAEAFGFAGESAQNDLYAALQSGEITFNQFSDMLLELNDGVGGFAEMAKVSTGGIGTAWTNLKTAIVRGTANIVDAVDTGLSQTRFKSIENVIQSMQKGIVSSLQIVAAAFQGIASQADVLIPLLIGIGAAITAWKVTPVILSIVSGFQTAALQVSLYAASVNGAVTADALQTAGLTAKEIVVGVLTGKISLATAAQAAWNAVVAAHPIGAAVTAVIALTAGISALVSWLSKGSKEYQEQKEAVEELTDAQEALAESQEESSEAWEESVVRMNADAEAASDLVDEIASLAKQTDASGKNADEMANKVAELNNAVEGLNVTYDRETGTIRNLNSNQEVSLDQLRDLVDAKSELAKTEAWTKRQTELFAEQAQITEELSLIESKRQEILANTELTAREQNKLIEELDASAAEYAAQMEESEARLDIVNENLAASTAESAQQIVSDYELMESAVTKNGETIEQIAEQWGTSTESILQDMKDQNISLDEWVTGQEEAVERQKEAFAELEEAVKEKTEGIVNSFEEIPAEFDQSAEEMLEILIHNKEQYARWEANMEEITRLLGPTAAEEFGKLGPEANSAMEEILASEELLAQYQEVFGVTIDETTGAAIEAWNDPDFIGAPAAAMESAASQISESSTLNEAAQSQVEGTKEAFDDAVETVDFGAVGSSISQAIEDGMSSLNLTEVTGTITTQLRQMDTQAITLTAEMTRGIASAISASTTNIKSQMQRLSTAAVDGLKTMVSGGKNQAKLAMSQISAEILSGRTRISSQMKALAESVTDVLEGITENAKTMATKAMTNIVAALTSKRTAVTQQASAISNGVSGALQGMVLGGRSAANQMMAGILVAMNASAQSIYNKAAQIANNVSATMRRALQVRSPSRVMIDIFRNVILGAVKGLDDMAGKAYSTASTIATGIASRLTISPETARMANARLLAYSDAAMYRAAQPAAVSVSTGHSAAQQSSDNSDLLQAAVDLLSKYLPEVANMQLVLDTGATVGGLAPAMDEALGRRARKKVRG